MLLFRNPDLHTDTSRAAFGLGIGAMVGGMMTSVFLAFQNVDNARMKDAPSVFSLTMLPSVVVWCIGLYTVGALGWFLLHRIKLRGPLTAALFGLVLTFAASWVVDPAPDWTFHGLLPVAGVVVAMVIWLFSYKKAPVVAG